jgi:hypothetical protein
MLSVVAVSPKPILFFTQQIFCTYHLLLITIAKILYAVLRSDIPLQLEHSDFSPFLYIGHTIDLFHSLGILSDLHILRISSCILWMTLVSVGSDTEFILKVRSFKYIINNSEPRIYPCGTPCINVPVTEKNLSHIK